MWQLSPRKPCSLTGALAWAVIRMERDTHCLARARLSCEAGDLGWSMFSSAALFFICWELVVLGNHLIVDLCLHWGTYMYMNCVEEIVKDYVLGFILIFFFAIQQSFRRAQVELFVPQPQECTSQGGSLLCQASFLTASECTSACVTGNEFEGMCKTCMWEEVCGEAVALPPLLMGSVHPSADTPAQSLSLSEVSLTLWW